MFNLGVVTVHFHFQDPEFPDTEAEADIFLIRWNGAAVVETRALNLLNTSNPTLIDRCLDVMLAATAAHLAIRWIGGNHHRTHSRSMDNSHIENGRCRTRRGYQKSVRSPYGNPTATALGDAEGSLVRIRVPLERTPIEIMDFVDHIRRNPGALILISEWM